VETIARHPDQNDFFLSFVALKILHLKYKFWPDQRVGHKFLEKARNVPIRFLDPSVHPKTLFEIPLSLLNEPWLFW